MNHFEQWVKERQQSVTGPQGDVSLIAMHEITEAIAVPQIPGVWSPTKQGTLGLTLTTDTSQQLKIDGQVLDGTYSIIADRTVVIAENGRTAMATSQPGSDHLLAIWDAHCEALQNFISIERFSYNEQAVVEGQFVIDKEEQTYSFIHTADVGHRARQHVSPGEIIVHYEGHDYRLRPFASEDYYIVVFRDATSGVDTYGTGRMLVVRPDEQGRVKLDFNYAFLPPCAFSLHFNCPMPPLSNRFKTGIYAGEKHVKWRE